MELNLLSAIADRFELDGQVAEIKALGDGFINDTFVIKTGAGAPDYILQRKNHRVFNDVPAMMDNIDRVTAHLRAKVEAAGGDPLREVLTVIPTHDGRLYHKEGDDYWAVCRFIDGSVVHEVADTPHLAFMGGKGIGRFQSMLADFDEPLADVIPGFHNVRHRLRQWDETLAADPAGRRVEVAAETEWISSRRERMLGFWRMVEDGRLPLHVTHNDTKLSNILFDCNDDVLCVIDLDTVMSSTSLNDFGDAIRSYANTGAEDAECLDSVSMDIEIFRHYAAGYLSERRDLMTATEKQWLAFSALYITYEQVLRFLMDYIAGDTYYNTRYPKHNLVRARAQYRLLQSMEEQYPMMQRIVEELAE